MGILTDREHTPATIASRMLDYGYNDYTMYIGEHLGHPTKELIRRMTLEEAAAETFEYPNCLILTTGDGLQSVTEEYSPLVSSASPTKHSNCLTDVPG